MVKDIVRYIIIILIVIGIVLVMKNLISDDSEFEDKKDGTDKVEDVLYSANISLIDKDTDEFLEGATLVVKDENGDVIDSWETDDSVHVISSLSNGTYTLEESEAPSNYNGDDEGVTFVIDNANVDVAMYNSMMSDEEIALEREKNTTSSEIGVDNTSSSSNKFISIVAVMIFMGGTFILSRKFVYNI